MDLESSLVKTEEISNVSSLSLSRQMKSEYLDEVDEVPQRRKSKRLSTRKTTNFNFLERMEIEN